MTSSGKTMANNSDTGGVNASTQQQLDLSYVPSKYSKAFHTYSKTQIKFIMPFLASISRSCTLGPHYPVCKVMKVVSKIFLLN